MTLRAWLDNPPAARATAWAGQTHVILYDWKTRSYEIRSRNILRTHYCPDRAAVETEWRRLGRSLNEVGQTY